ncbi:MAG: hypothetical protein KC457_32490, partial [Myxococcales bacterium]|nr:hypothetical protein [Myxococcales bacterium]
RIDDADPLCLDGARLKLISGTHLHPGAVYRPKRDDLSRVTIISGSPDGALICDSPGFEVRRADGIIDLYGCRRDAVALHPLGAAAWSLARRSDRFGNYVDYRYGYDHQAGADVERWLTAIDYGGHPTHAPVRHLRLTWEQRPDPHHGWMLSAPVHQTKRLAALETFSQGELVHRYELDYDTPTVTGRSLLHALRQCDALGVCRPDTTFSWEPGELAFADVAEGENFELFQSWPFLDDPNNDADDVYQAGVLAQTILDAGSAPSPRSSPAKPTTSIFPTTPTTAWTRSTTPKPTWQNPSSSATSTPRPASSRPSRAPTTSCCGPSRPPTTPAASPKSASATAPRPSAATTPSAASSNSSTPPPSSAATSSPCATSGTPPALSTNARTCSTPKPSASTTTTCTASSPATPART